MDSLENPTAFTPGMSFHVCLQKIKAALVGHTARSAKHRVAARAEGLLVCQPKRYECISHPRNSSWLSGGAESVDKEKAGFVVRLG